MIKTYSINGEDLTLRQIAKKYDINYGTLHSRITRHSTKDISGFLYKKMPVKAKTHSINGEELTLRQVSENYEIELGVLKGRVNRHPTKDISDLLYKRNTAKTHSVNGEDLTLIQVSEKYDIDSSTFGDRIRRYPTKDISELLYKKRTSRAKTHSVNGEDLTLRQVTEKYNIGYTTLIQRIMRYPTKDISDLLYKRNTAKTHSVNGEDLTLIQVSEKYDIKYSTLDGRVRRHPTKDFSDLLYKVEKVLLSDKYPEIAKEWHPTKNTPHTPEDFTYSSGRFAWWLCPNEHSYEAQISSRTNSMSSCPDCSNQSSRPEIRILTELKYIFSEVLSRDKSNGFEIDVFIPEFAIGVEYDGSYYHSGSAKNEKDKAKNEILEKKGIQLVRVREAPLEKITPSDIIVHYKKGRDKGITKKAMNLIVSEIGARIYPAMKDEITAYIKGMAFNNEELFLTYLGYFPRPFPEHALPSTHPELCKEWHPTKNAPLTPENFTYGVGIAVWWLCPNEHSYEAEIQHRTKTRGTGCPDPYCVREKRLPYENRLSVRYPEVAKEWHPTLNGSEKPEYYSYGSDKKVWWLCPKKHDYHRIIRTRTIRALRTTDCPECIKENRRKKKEKALPS